MIVTSSRMDDSIKLYHKFASNNSPPVLYSITTVGKASSRGTELWMVVSCSAQKLCKNILHCECV